MQTTTHDVRYDDQTVVITRPAESGPWPGVVMIHEAWGLGDVLRRQAARLASRGYIVLAPDLMTEKSRLACMVACFKALQAGQGRPFELIEACRTRLTSDEDCNGRVGVIGFCMGGGFALLLGNRGFDVSSVNYGMPPNDPDSAFAGACPMVLSYGGKDKQLMKKLPQIEDALQRHDVTYDLKVYPDAGHSFMNDENNAPLVFRPMIRVTGAGPDPEAAEDAWERIEAFFVQHLRYAIH